MSDLNASIIAALEARYKKLASGVHELAAPLSDHQFWRKPFLFGNSFGHLVLHVTGNLNYYIGAQIGQSGYVRDRPREFTESSPLSKAETLKRFDEAIEVVLQAIHRQSQEDLVDCLHRQRKRRPRSLRYGFAMRHPSTPPHRADDVSVFRTEAHCVKRRLSARS
jgi:hypothetical protein